MRSDQIQVCDDHGVPEVVQSMHFDSNIPAWEVQLFNGAKKTIPAPTVTPWVHQGQPITEEGYARAVAAVTALVLRYPRVYLQPHDR
jgi:hypothetical protein